MPACEVDICNLALAYLGVKRAFIDGSGDISAVSDASLEAQVCNLHYAMARREVLCQFAWPFAVKRVSCAESVYQLNVNPATDPALYPMTHRFPVPSDMLRILEIADPNNPTKMRHVYQAIDYRYEWSIQDRNPAPPPYRHDLQRAMIFVDAIATTMYLVYVADVATTTLFDAHFSDALAWRLSMKILLPLTGDRNRYKTLHDSYKMVLASAKAHTAQYGQALPPPPESEYTKAR